MKKFLPLTFTLAFLCAGLYSKAQTCPTGYTSAALNWDNLDFLIQDVTYITAAKAQTQTFAFGSNKLTITHNYASGSVAGETLNQTGKTGSYAAGADVEFSGNGIITLTFGSAVQNVKFSIQDVEKGQSMALTAVNGATPTSIALTTCAASGTTSLTLVNNNSNNPSVTSLDGKNAIGDVDNATNLGSFNVDVSGPVTSITITTSIVSPGFNRTGNNPDFFLSDISACINTLTPFPSNYYATSKPFTGQPGYVLAAIDDSIIMVNPANGISRFLFKDPTRNNINSVGYDPYNKFIYYTYSLTASGGTPNQNDKSIQKYDVNTGVISTVVSDVTTLGIPLYTSGVESGGAAFYDGALYLGIEGENGDESKIWRIDFDPLTFNPINPARQVYAVPTDFHDWSDFVISNGVLYDFDGKSSTTATHYENIDHISLITGATIATYPYSALQFVPRQVAVDWTEKLYNMGTAATTSSGTVVPYANGAITTAQQYNITMGTVTPSGSWGDAGEAFRPKADFGDAPASFDPDPLAPAMHELDPNLRLGNTLDIEWNKPTALGTNADVDGSDEDGLTFVRIMNMRSGSYQTDVNVYNNTGAAATVAAWVDFNGDGIFQSTEGIMQSVATGTGMQTVSLYWTGIGVFLADNSRTFLRIRITSAANGMTTSNPTGYFANGEVEDYYVLVNVTPLDVTLKNFTAKKTSDTKVLLTWNIVDEKTQTSYELQKSTDGINWKSIYTKTAMQDNATVAYSYEDVNSLQTQAYYRLRLSAPNKTDAYSAVQKITYNGLTHLAVSPNPAASQCKLEIVSTIKETAHVSLINVSGVEVYHTTLALEKGGNSFLLATQNFQDGVYTLRVVTASAYESKRLIIQKK